LAETTSSPDPFAGLALTDEQKAKIEQIHQETKSRLEAVTKDQKLSPEVKDAMLQGYRRLENGKIFDVLTPDQQREVRKRMSAWRAAARQQQHQSRQLQPPVQPPGGESHPQ
jgi:Spy/CpxP family protein refolding chaperone